MIIGSIVISAALAATAAARPPASVGDIVTSPLPGTNLVLARKLLPPSKAAGVMAQSKVIYLNHLGVTLTPGDDDSTTNHSSIIGATSMVPAWNTSQATWNATVACMQDMFARFDVTVTDQDPGATPHIEAVFGGSPQDIGMGQGVGGVSPFTEDCGIIENSIVFTFTDVFPDDAQTVCEVMAQEVAHSYGLDHEMLASDPMTYLQYNGNRSFKDQTVSCGEYQDRPCGIGGSTCRPSQNSVQLLYERVGKADLVPPTLAITAPADGATVPPGFSVEAMASDDVGVTMTTLSIDGQPAGTVPGAGPYSFATDPALANGPHTLRVEATDGRNTQAQSITVIVGVMPTGSDGGSATGSDDNGNGGAGDDGTVHGGCSTSGGSGGALLVGLALCLRRRRRRA
jgi:hypothetical protein